MKKAKSKGITKTVMPFFNLRDYFAAQALMGLLADHKDHADECKKGESCQDAVARLAYEFADAMIERMNKVNHNGLKAKKLTKLVK